MKRYDLVVIGGGTAGIVGSLLAADLGARVALIERDRPGGECLFTGCVPSKSLLAPAGLAHRMRHADRLGLEPVEPRIDFARVMERVDAVIEAAGQRDSAEYLESRGVEVVRDRGRFAGPGRVALETGTRELRYRTALIATGSRPAVPPVPGLEQGAYLTNETVFGLRERPPRLAVLGGGAVGVELAQAFARLGSGVTVVEMERHLLPREEAEAGDLIAGKLDSEGVTVLAGSKATAVEPADGGAGTLAVEVAGNGEWRIEYDRILVAAGRRPATGDLGLDSVGVELDAGGAVRVDRHLRTTGNRIYAAGDVGGGLLFTHVAAYEATEAVANALFRVRRKVDYSAIPRVTFTDPEVARVGLTAAEARAQLGTDPLVLRYDYAQMDRALVTGGAEGFAKLVADRRGRLLGATVVGPAAGESIAEVARALRDGRKAGDLSHSQMVHAYPTFTQGPAHAADEWWRNRYLTAKARRCYRPLLALLRRIDHPRGS